jgi:hypothetical protein
MSSVHPSTGNFPTPPRPAAGPLPSPPAIISLYPARAIVLTARPGLGDAAGELDWGFRWQCLPELQIACCEPGSASNRE